MTSRPRPLGGRVVLVLGAGDRATREAALRLSALGATILAAAPHPGDAVTTAGLVAASGGTARVVEEASPPLAGDGLLRAARALAPPTDALVAEAAFGGRAAAQAAADALAAALPAGARVLLVEAGPGAGSRTVAARIADAFLGGPR